MASQIETAITTYRQQLLAGDARALAMLTQAYQPVRARLVAAIDDLLAEIAAKGLTESAVFKLDRAAALLQQIEDELARLATSTNGLITAGQRQAVQLALAHAEGLVAAQEARIAAAFTRVPVAAVSDLVGRLSDGSPLRAWLDGLGSETADAVSEALKTGLAIGQHPQVIASELAQTVDVAMGRLLTTTRTAILGSYRSATLASYRENSDILSGWIWLASIGPGTCASCLSLSGQHFPLSEEFFPSHPNCRCTAIPDIKGVGPPDLQDGAEWFDGQSAATQDRILGKAGGNAYRNGDVALADFTALRRDSRWGDAYVQSSLRGALARADSRERRAA